MFLESLLLFFFRFTVFYTHNSLFVAKPQILRQWADFQMIQEDIALWKTGLKSPLHYNDCDTWQPYLSGPCVIWSHYTNICCISYSPLFDRNTYIHLNSLPPSAFYSYLNSSAQIIILQLLSQLSLFSETD